MVRRIAIEEESMDSRVEGFGKVAVGLARNPLGIIALFIVMVYGFACLVTGLTGAFSSVERLPLVYFLVVFPVLVLGVFAWLVSCHNEKLFGPSDYKSEDNYVRMRMSAVASLAVATTKRDTPNTEEQIKSMVDMVQSTVSPRSTSVRTWRNHILWVDDLPDNNVYERKALEAFGMKFTLALSTDEALKKLAAHRFAAVISDMGRREGPREGYVLLDKIRQQGNLVPVFFYASSNAPEHKRETEEHGGQGCTNDAQELFQMVTKELISGND
jgi:CheY-like chemotaxis protein